MNLSSFSFFRPARSGSQQFAVIGLGRFGRAVCSTLHKMGYEVMGADFDAKQVTQVANDQTATHVMELDSTDPVALKQAGIFEFDTVIVAIGNFIEESVITTLNLKEGGVSYVVAKASSQIHEKLLKKVGADRVVFPEYEMGCTLARSLTQPSILERFELDPDNSIVEVLVPAEFDGKTIAETQLRNRYGLNLIAISQDRKLEINPISSQRLQKGSAMVLIGSNKDINRLPL
ncbi:TrkA family potassium uptake protein [Desertifilum sp. FACHB-1129]|uniref:Potassium transporter n=1 Tax=Desertifilum tharense IPPAS B-1220 TaxID=1781255 RepID=A0A1E5QED4_9CYAN|nr:TrkA family potassium uptake protein [Desertifilum tharense]MBD2315131.1 TrkA family potassium uptake protein [Desertifilum sp. FACHB-1129]MBD2325068.1 TrkA family potassium uptake protein [Desertifilum sp. FACHB-866]MBD2335243.1 TrkA family potassium uptake protein [Desertifilum sp. FACHB-868]MCD8488436.1 TrkA family potassium uptake protein [Desertifilum sp.]MDA0213610.1 TrkA family potassium uptake protein [Cyanobacteria bacterium FC1]